MPLELLGLSFFFAFAVGLFVWQLLMSFIAVQEQAETQDEMFSDSPLFKAMLPFVQAIGRTLGGLAMLDGMRKELRKQLTRAGKADAISPDEFLGFMILCGLLGLVVGGYFVIMIDAKPTTAMGIALLVFYLPKLSLNDKVSQRQKAIRKILPYTLDLLCLAVEAGMDFTAALNRIGEKLRKSPFREEITILSRDLSMGKTRGEALRDMDKRIGLEELTGVVSALVQADELGASLGPTLRIQSRELQRKRFQLAEKKAMQAPVLMLLPLVVFIFPLVFAVIFTPIILQVMDMGVF